MGSLLQYRIPVDLLEEEGYCITNGLAKDYREGHILGLGNRLGIKVISHKGFDIEKQLSGRRYSESFKKACLSTFQGEVIADYPITRISLSDSHVTLYFLPPVRDENRDDDDVDIFAESGLEIYFEIPSYNELPPAQFLISSYYSSSGYQMMVTEFHGRMTKDIAVVSESNPNYNPQIHDHNRSDIDFLLITEHWD